MLEVYGLNSTLSLDNKTFPRDSITDIKLEAVKVDSRPLCMLVFKEASQKVTNQVWDYDDEKQSLQSVLNTSAPYNKLLIPATTTYYIVEDVGESRTTLSFYSLDAQPKATVKVVNYKWIKVE
jgi:hypothetical protein